MVLKPEPSIALGMILVASCPSGNISNFLVNYARGNTALSVTIAAFSVLPNKACSSQSLYDCSSCRDNPVMTFSFILFLPAGSPC